MLTASIFVSRVGPVHSPASCGAWLFVVVVMVVVLAVVHGACELVFGVF